MKSRGDASSWAVVLIAATSLALMVILYQIDWIIRTSISDYGLSFSNNWVAPYWRFMQTGFALAWINIATAFAVQAHNIRMNRKDKQSMDPIENAWKLARSPETEGDSQEEAGEQREVDSNEPAEKNPTNHREPEARENKEEPQRPNETPEQESQLPQNKPDEPPPVLPGLFQALPNA